MLETPKDAFRLREVPEEQVGIEIEVEFTNDVDEISFGKLPNWTVTSDGSLRNGMEFISRPLHMSEVPAEVSSAMSYIKKRGPRPSHRTSVHVHYNAAKMTLHDLQKIVGVYYMLETMLIKAYAPDRLGNKFCLRGLDAADHIDRISNLFKGGWQLFDFSREVRYAALNLTPLSYLGTLEFRFLDGTHDENKIIEFVETINRLVRVATGSTLRELQSETQESLYRLVTFRPLPEGSFEEDEELGRYLLSIQYCPTTPYIFLTETDGLAVNTEAQEFHAGDF